MRDYKLFFPEMRKQMREKKININDSENPWIVLFRGITSDVHKNIYNEFRSNGLYPTLPAMAERDDSQHNAWYWLSTTSDGQTIFSDLLYFFSSSCDELIILPADLSEAFGHLKLMKDDDVDLFYRLVCELHVFPAGKDLPRIWNLLDQGMGGGRATTFRNIAVRLLENEKTFPAVEIQFQNLWLMKSIRASFFAKLIQRGILPHDEITWRACYASVNRGISNQVTKENNISLAGLFKQHFNVAPGFTAKALICHDDSCRCSSLVCCGSSQHQDFVRELLLGKKGSDHQLLSTTINCWGLFRRALIQCVSKYQFDERGGATGKRRAKNLLAKLNASKASNAQGLAQLYCAILYSTSFDLKESFLNCLKALKKCAGPNFEDDKVFSGRLLKIFQEEQGITEDSCRSLLKILEAEEIAQSKRPFWSGPVARHAHNSDSDSSGFNMHK